MCVYQCFYVCFPETNSCASKPLKRNVNIKHKGLSYVSFGLKGDQKGAQDLKLNKELILYQKSWGYQFLRSAVPKLDLVPASSYKYNVYKD